MNGSRHLWLAVGLATGLLFAALSASAEEIEESDVQAWVQYEYQHRITEKLRGSWDLGYRELVSTEDILGDWSRLHLRSIFSYAYKNWVTFDGGIGGYYTFSDNLTDLLELRTWQSAVFFWPRSTLAGRRFDLRHRFRLEQRWVSQQDTGEKDFGLRLRYRLATFFPLNRPTIEKKAWYMPLMGEAFANLGGDSPDYFAERLRLSIGLGHVLSDNWTLEFRYTAQKSRDTVVGRFQTTDHILDLRIRTAVRLRDMLPSL
jgi:hypothetical protein